MDKISGPAAGVITNAASAITSVTGLVQGIYLFELKVTDNTGATAIDVMQVTVNPALIFLLPLMQGCIMGNHTAYQFN